MEEAGHSSFQGNKRQETDVQGCVLELCKPLCSSGILNAWVGLDKHGPFLCAYEGHIYTWDIFSTYCDVCRYLPDHIKEVVLDVATKQTLTALLLCVAAGAARVEPVDQAVYSHCAWVKLSFQCNVISVSVRTEELHIPICLPYTICYVAGYVFCCLHVKDVTCCVCNRGNCAL